MAELSDFRKSKRLKKRKKEKLEITTQYVILERTRSHTHKRSTAITSPGWMHETSARTWCTGKTQRDRLEREVGRGIRMGNTCKSMADSCQCMTKTTTIL